MAETPRYKPSKVLIMGLPGAGKTTLAEHLAPRLPAVWFDADEVRKLWPELDFSHKARIEQARRMGMLCDIVNKQGYDAIASFVCPTQETRAAFKATFTIWIDRIKKGRFADTNEMFVSPANADIRLVIGSPRDWVDAIMRRGIPR